MSGLTAVLSQQTTVPAPDVNSVPNPGGGASTFDLQPSKERHVTVDVCSEFMSYTAPVNVISSKDDIELVQDTEGQPIILALSGDQVSSGTLRFLYVVSCQANRFSAIATSSCARSCQRRANCLPAL